MKKQFFILLLCLYFFHTKAQVSEFVYFNKTLSSDTINILSQAVKPIENGYLSLGGYATTEYYVLYISRLNLLGETEWIKPFEIIENIADLGIIEWGGQALINNNLLVAIYDHAKNLCFSKFNADGDTVLHKKYIQPGWQLGKHLIATPDGGYMIAGMEQKTTADTVKAYALKIDSMGNYEWDKRYLMGNDARFFSVQHTPWDGGYIFGGMGYSTTTGYDMFVVKTLANGDTLWTKRYGNELNDCAAKVVSLTTYEEWLAGQETNYLMTGCFKEGTSKKLHLSIIGENGVVKWERKHGLFPNISSFQVLPLIKPDKGFIGSGYYMSNGFTPQPYIAAFHANGDLDWVTTPTINPDSQIYLKDLQPTPDGGYGQYRSG